MDDPDEAVIRMLEGRWPVNVDTLEYPVKVYEYETPEIPLSPDDVLDHVLERLDEDYADPDGPDSVATPGMMAAAERFVEVMRKEYRPGACRQTGKVIEYDREAIVGIIESKIEANRREG
jgi:hypothetical protein